MQKVRQAIAYTVAALLIAVGALAFAPGIGVAHPEEALAKSMKVTSAGIKDGKIAKKYGYNHGNTSIPLKVKNIPKKAKYLAIYMRDLDVDWDHWLAANLSKGKSKATSKKIVAGASNKWASKMVQGITGVGIEKYEGPHPPVTHTYAITVYALKSKVDLSAGFTYSQFKKAIKGKVVKKCTIKGKYTYTS